MHACSTFNQFKLNIQQKIITRKFSKLKDIFNFNEDIKILVKI